MLLCLEPVVCKGISNEMGSWLEMQTGATQSKLSAEHSSRDFHAGPGRLCVGAGKRQGQFDRDPHCLDEVTDFVPQS